MKEILVVSPQSQTSSSLIELEEVDYLNVTLRLRGLLPFVYLWMNIRIREKVILRRLAFYLTTILETGTGVKKQFTESLMLYCSQEKETAFRGDLVFCEFLKETGALLL